MPRGALLCAVILGCSHAPPPARGPGCDVTVSNAAPTTRYPLAPPRKTEAFVEGGYAGDYNDQRKPSANFVTGAEGAVWMLPDQRFRLSLRIGLVFGRWGDDRHGPLTIDPGLRLRTSVWMNDFFDTYVVGKLSVPVNLSGDQIGLRQGLGLGIRALRLVQLEGTGDALAVDGRLFPGLSVTLGLDLCPLGVFDCSAPAPRPPRARALTCDLYRAAHAIRCASSKAERCEAVDAALDPTLHPPEQIEGRLDGVYAFVRALPQHARDALLKQKMQELEPLYRRLFSEWASAREAERHAAQYGRTLAEHCSFSPSAVEMRAVFGCDPDPDENACARPLVCVD